MLQFRVNGQRIERIDDSWPVQDSVNYLTAEFDFDETWDGTARIASFIANNVTHTVLLENEVGNTSKAQCDVPSAVLRYDKFSISVYGAINDEDTPVLITTDRIRIRVGESGYTVLEPSAEETSAIIQILEDYAAIENNYVQKETGKGLSEVNFTAVYRDRLNAASRALSSAILGEWKPAEVGAIAHDHTPVTATSTTIALMPVPTEYTDLFTALDAWRIKVKEDEDTDGVPTDYDFVLAEYLINISVIEDTTILFKYGGSAVSVDVIGGHHDILGNVYLTGGKSYRIHLRDGMGTVEEVSA